MKPSQRIEALTTAERIKSLQAGAHQTDVLELLCVTRAIVKYLDEADMVRPLVPEDPGSEELVSLPITVSVGFVGDEYGGMDK